MKVKLIYDPLDGMCCPDGRIPEFVSCLLRPAQISLTFIVGSELILYEFRLLKKQKIIDDLVIILDGNEIPIDADGRYVGGFDYEFHSDKCLCDLL